jgi:hypothetical protein
MKPDSRARAETIEQRLIDGEQKIAAAQQRGEDTSRLIDFWIRLLAEYEDLMEDVTDAIHDQDR